MDEADEYEITLKVRAQSTLRKDELKRCLVVALWEGMDESVVIPDGATDELKVIEYEEVTVEEIV